jgi:CBS domain-containing protein
MSWIVSDVMTKDPVTVGPSTSFKACANLMRIHEVSAIPVVDRGARLVGIVSEFDLLAKQAQGMVRSRPQHAGGKSKAIRAAELMTAGLVTTTAGAPLATAASLMFQHHLKVLPVVDSEQRPVGMVSRAQVLKVFLRSDESIRREVVRSLCDIPSMNRPGSEIEVKEGVVHLHFAEEELSLAEVIGRRVTGIPGVVGVTAFQSAAKLDAGRRSTTPRGLPGESGPEPTPRSYGAGQR